jgi:endonuclease YncB( thermonuclease family)
MLLPRGTSRFASCAVLVTVGSLAGFSIGQMSSTRAVEAGTGARKALSPAAAPAPSRPIVDGPTYPAEVLRVVDGDTFEARVRVWPGLDVTTKVRLLRIDAPEMRARCSEERIGAEAARDRLATILNEGAVSIAAVRLDKYGGRVLASAATGMTPDVSAAMLAAGLARPYAGGRRESWCGIASR